MVGRRKTEKRRAFFVKKAVEQERKDERSEKERGEREPSVAETVAAEPDQL